MAEAKPPKVFDVAKPGKSAPSSSAKPIIVTNRPVLKDPMVNEDKAQETVVAKTQKQPLTVTGKKIEPIHIESEIKLSRESLTKSAKTSSDETPPESSAETATEDSQPAAETTAADTPVPAEPVSEPAPDTETEKKAAAPTSPDPEPSVADDQDKVEDKTTEPATSASEPAPADHDELKDVDTEANDNAAELAAQKEQERAAELQKLADSHQYYLPINQVERRRNKRAVWIGIIVIVLLSLAWADVALDAGLIRIPGVHAPTHFFGN